MDDHTDLEELEWGKLAPVGPHDADRLEYVIEQLEEGDELAEDLTWGSDLVDGVTVEELLGALGEAKHLLEGY